MGRLSSAVVEVSFRRVKCPECGVGFLCRIVVDEIRVRYQRVESLYEFSDLRRSRSLRWDYVPWSSLHYIDVGRVAARYERCSIT